MKGEPRILHADAETEEAHTGKYRIVGKSRALRLPEQALRCGHLVKGAEVVVVSPCADILHPHCCIAAPQLVDCRGAQRHHPVVDTADSRERATAAGPAGLIIFIVCLGRAAEVVEVGIGLEAANGPGIICVDKVAAVAVPTLQPCGKQLVVWLAVCIDTVV